MSRARVPWQVAVVATFLLLLAVLPAYYVVHKPFQDVIEVSAPVVTGDAASVMLALLSLLANFMLLILTLAVVAAWGSRISRWLGIKFDSELERWALGATLGLGMLGTLVFIWKRTG